MSKATKETVDLLTKYVPAEAHVKIEQAVLAMADEIKAEALVEAAAGNDPATSEKLESLIEQRDQAIERARNAEHELAEVRQELDVIVEKAKKAVEDEMKSEIEKAAEIVDKSEKEKDELAEALRSEYEEKLSSFKEDFINKTSRFIDGRLHSAFQKLGESVSNDPTKISESDAFKRIAEIVENFSTTITGGITEKEAKDIREELIGLRAQVKQTEASNARLRTENRIIREKYNSGGEITTEGGDPAKIKPKVDSGAADYKSGEGLADKEGNKVSNGEDVYEPAGNITRDKKRPGLVGESKAAQRASELLREALLEKPQGGDEEGWASTIGESRSDRQMRASEVEGSGITIHEADIVKETVDSTDTRRSQIDEAVIPGTGTKLGDFKRMAGVPASAR